MRLSRRTKRTDRSPFTVFLDRDGVLNPHPRLQLRRWKDFQWLPGVPEALQRLKQAGMRTCLVTNQPGTGALLSTPSMIDLLHARMQEDLDRVGARLDRIEVCFRAPGLPGRRKKPRPGMLEDAAAAFSASAEGFDAGRALMVGDKPKDAQAAAAFGIPCILVATTYGHVELERTCRERRIPYLAIADDLPAAVDLVLSLADDGRWPDGQD